MEDFIVNNYVWIVIVCLFIIFTLIGYMADKSSKNKKEKNDVISKRNPNNYVESKNTNDKNNEIEITSKSEVSKDEKSPEIEVNNNSQTSESEKKEDTTPSQNIQGPTLDELMEKSKDETTFVKIPEENNESVNESLDDKESVSKDKNINNGQQSNEESKVENPTIYNSWEPELEEENKDIITETKE